MEAALKQTNNPILENQIIMAAKRRNKILEALMNSSKPLTTDDLFEKPRIRDLCKGKWNVTDDLKSMMQAKEVIRVPSGNLTHRFAYMISPEAKGGDEMATKEQPKRTNVTQLKRRATDVAVPAAANDTVVPVLAQVRTISDRLDVVDIFMQEQEKQSFLRGLLLVFPEYKHEVMPHLKQ